MKILICGSRSITNPPVIAQAVARSGMNPTHIISGGARGVDTLASLYAMSNSIDFTEYPADWKTHGKQAGFRRNITMVDTADAVIAIWDGESRGTKHSIDYAKKLGKEVFVYVRTA